MSFLFYTSIVLFILVCLILIMLVLIQKGRGGGLSGAFGGGGGNTAFGAKTGDVLTWATSIVFGVFVLLAIVLNLLANYRHKNSMPTAFTPPANSVPAGGINTSSAPPEAIEAPRVPAVPTTQQ